MSNGGGRILTTFVGLIGVLWSSQPKGTIEMLALIATCIHTDHPTIRLQQRLSIAERAWIRDFLAVGAPVFTRFTDSRVFGPDVRSPMYCFFTFILYLCAVFVAWRNNSFSVVCFIVFSFWLLVLFSLISLATEGKLSNPELRRYGILIIILDWSYSILSVKLLICALSYHGELLLKYLQESISSKITIASVSILLIPPVRRFFISAFRKWNQLQRPPRYGTSTDNVNAALVLTFWEHLETCSDTRVNLINALLDGNSSRRHAVGGLLNHILALYDTQDRQLALLDEQNEDRVLHDLREGVKSSEPIDCAAVAFWLFRGQDPVTVLLTKGGALPEIGSNNPSRLQLNHLTSCELLALYISKMLNQNSSPQFCRSGFFQEGSLVVTYTMAEYVLASKIKRFYPLLDSMDSAQRSCFTNDQRKINVGRIRKTLVTGFSGAPAHSVVARRSINGLVLFVGSHSLILWAVHTRDTDLIFLTFACVMLGVHIEALAETGRCHIEHILTTYEYLWFIICLRGQSYPSCRGMSRDQHIVKGGICFSTFFLMFTFLPMLFEPQFSITVGIAFTTFSLTVVPSILGHFGPPGVFERLDRDDSISTHNANNPP